MHTYTVGLYTLKKYLKYDIGNKAYRIYYEFQNVYKMYNNVPSTNYHNMRLFKDIPVFKIFYRLCLYKYIILYTLKKYIRFFFFKLSISKAFFVFDTKNSIYFL